MVSVLFSEPKIPQWNWKKRKRSRDSPFQCSSASRKFLNWISMSAVMTRWRCFSALQRAENSSINYPNIVVIRSAKFQCSSASRKFLNCGLAAAQSSPDRRRFSALQRAENSSMVTLRANALASLPCFSALQRAENSSIQQALDAMTELVKFQCSSASRKFLNRGQIERIEEARDVSVLFSEPKIPQCSENSASSGLYAAFQCSSASRKFLNPDRHAVGRDKDEVSVLFSEPKIPQCNIRTAAQRRTAAFQCSSASRKFLN